MGQNLSKTFEVLVTPSSSFQCRSGSKFDLPYVQLNLVETWYRGQFKDVDLEFELKKSGINTI